MKILYISPTGKGTYKKGMINILKKYKNSDTEITYMSLTDENPDNLEFRSFEGLILSNLINLVYNLSDNYDCIIIGGFFDPGIKELREISKNTPIVAPFHASMSVASTLGNKISIIVGKDKWVNRIEENIYIYGLKNLISSIKSIDYHVHELQNNKNVLENIITKGKNCIENDLAEVIILGCTVNYGFSEKIKKILNVPVIEPIPVTLKYAEMMAYMSLKCGYLPSSIHSSKSPDVDEIKKYILKKEPFYANKYIIE